MIISAVALAMSVVVLTMAETVPVTGSQRWLVILIVFVSFMTNFLGSTFRC